MEAIKSFFYPPIATGLFIFLFFLMLYRIMTFISSSEVVGMLLALVFIFSFYSLILGIKLPYSFYGLVSFILAFKLINFFYNILNFKIK